MGYDFCFPPLLVRFLDFVHLETNAADDHGEFRIDQPFLDLPNVIASPHNSAQGSGAHDISLRRAVKNCRCALTGEAPLHVIGLDDRLM